MSTPETPSPQSPPKPWAIKAKFLGIGLGIGLLVGLIGIGKTYIDFSTTVAERDAALATARAQSTVHEARAVVYRASSELASDNYGKANDDLDSARNLLDSLSPAGVSAAGLTADQVASARGRLQDPISMSEGEAGQRDRLIQAGESLDRLVPQ